MKLLTHDRTPPDAAWCEPPLADAEAALATRSADAPVLAGLPSTLVIPLAARAAGDRLFPRMCVDDAHAPRLLQALGVDATPYLADRSSVYGVLARTRLIRDRARSFFDRYPRSLGVTLGAGLSHYFQWLDQGSNLWIDAELPEVVQLRQCWLPSDGRRRLNVEFDATSADWWQRLGLPSGRHDPPLLLIAEGLVMYLQPAQVQRLLWTVGQHAPPGSMLLLDCLPWPSVGRASLHRSVRRTGAQFRHGLRSVGELAAAHPRLRLDGVHQVMEGYGRGIGAAAAVFRLVFGVPFYAVYELGVDA